MTRLCGACGDVAKPNWHPFSCTNVTALHPKARYLNVREIGDHHVLRRFNLNSFACFYGPFRPLAVHLVIHDE